MIDTRIAIAEMVSKDNIGVSSLNRLIESIKVESRFERPAYHVLVQSELQMTPHARLLLDEEVRRAKATFAVADRMRMSVLDSLTRMTDVMGKSLNASLATLTQQTMARQTVIDDLARRELKNFTAISRAQELLLWAELKTHRTDYARIGQVLAIDINRARTLAKSVAETIQSYTNYGASISISQPVELLRVSTLVEAPAREVFSLTNVAEILTHPNERVISDLEIAQQSQLVGETDIELRRLITALDPQLLTLLVGAEQAIHSSNPDRVRHCISSLRELFTHVLHALSPDDEVRHWTNDQTNFHNNKPTRRARLEFICRGICQQPLDEFLNKDISATLALFDLFQAGTHDIAPNVTTEQLMAIKLKTESALRFLMQLARLT